MKFKNVLLFFVVVSFFATPLTAQDFNETLSFDGLNREYILHLPTAYDANQPTPMVLALHGLGDFVSNFSSVGLSDVADTANFIVVYPQAMTSQVGNAWNNGATSFGITINNTIDDVGFLSALIDEVSNTYNVDPLRVYSTGFSMGGIMTHKLACELNDRLAAVASVAGPISEMAANACVDVNPVPVMHMHGDADGTVNYDTGNFIGGFDAALKGVDETIAFWVDKNTCIDDPIETDLPDLFGDGMEIKTFEYGPCAGQTEVLLYKILNGGHIWLSTNNDVNANVEIWEFFKQYTLPVSSDTENFDVSETMIRPNPFTNYIELEFEPSQFKELRMFNMLGQVVLEKNIEGQDGEMRLSTDRIERGSYIIQLSGNAIVESFKLIKQF